MMKTAILTSVLSVCLTACHMVEYHPYDANPSYKDLNRENIDRIEAACAGKKTIRYAWMGDSQRWYDESNDFVRDVNARGDIDFVIHGGDIADFGLVKEYEWMHRIFRKLDVPYVLIVGNHDLLGNGLHVYEKMYGPLNFTFIAGQTKFICVNTNALEFDYSRDVPDYTFLRGQVVLTEDEDHLNTVVAMHANPFGDQFNNNTAYYFQYLANQMKNLMYCTHAHAHGYMVNDFFEDGVIYYGTASMKDREYLIFTVSENEYTYERVFF